MYDSQDESLLAQRIADIRTRLRLHSRDPERPPALIAVTKTVPAERVARLPKGEIAGIGENRVQEVCEKYQNPAQFPPIHLIGRLQTNKVKYIIDKVCMIQSLDRPALAQEIDRQAQRRGLCMPVLLQVNIGHENQKGGLPPEELLDQARVYARLPGLSVRGLMAVLPLVQDLETLRPLFAQMRGLLERLRSEAIDGVWAEHLSMGMSADAYLAAQEGATMVRMGSAIFGPRAQRGSL